MSSSHQVRSTTASLLLVIAALVVVLPSAALWGTPSAAVFDLADRTVASAETRSGHAAADPMSILLGQDTSESSQLGTDVAPTLRTEPWQSPSPLLFVLVVVVSLWSALPVRLRARRRERVGRPADAEVHAACGVRAPPSLL